MTIGELKKLIENVPNEFIFEIEVSKKIDSERQGLGYFYPYDTERCQTDKGNYDIGWSESKMKINIEVTEL